MAKFVGNVLCLAEEKESSFKGTDVSKDIELEIDEGNLLAVDLNPLDLTYIRNNQDDYLKDLSRDNTQLLINAIWKLPVERAQDVILVKLPEPKTILPREKPIPKPRPETRWQKFAKLKGIQNQKRTRKVWDDQTQEWRPRWGYQRGNDDTKDWLIEVPQHVDPMEDQFEKRIEAKKERVAKNELQRLRNIARSQKSKVPGVGLTPTEAPTKDHVAKALTVAHRSTASIGKFTNRLPKEKTTKNSGKKRKFDSNMGDFSKERHSQLDILSKLTSKRPVLDVSKAVNQQLVQEDRKRTMERESGERRKKHMPTNRKKAGRIRKGTGDDFKGRTLGSKKRRGGSKGSTKLSGKPMSKPRGKRTPKRRS